MDLKLSNLIEIIYPTNLDNINLEKIKKKIDSLKISNLLNLNKKKLSKYFLVVTYDRNVIDFRLDPNFEIINLNNEIYTLENNDYYVINDGSEPCLHDNFHTNININVFENHKVSNQIAIKKILQTLNYPDNLLDNVLY